jgi:predicted RNase H-like HicB family nuclease
MTKRNSIEEYEALPFRMEISFDAVSDVWVVRYPELPGCTAHGASPQAAIDLGNEAKTLWIETALEEHQAIPRPLGEPEYSGKLVLRLPKTLQEAAARTAEREGVSLNAYLIQLVAEGVQRSAFKNLLDPPGDQPQRISGPLTYTSSTARATSGLGRLQKNR